jgi:polyisoprenoid-binding protein YceI
VTRAGFVATAVINRHHFNVDWDSALERGGSVVADHVLVTIDVEAIRNKEGLTIV